MKSEGKSCEYSKVATVRLKIDGPTLLSHGTTVDPTASSLIFIYLESLPLSLSIAPPLPFRHQLSS
ncbi:unnamed protein product [Prunus armeniaca]|uniref:Uncharacterized protein n=1 Tax=Prunus armeniaca TaxID=36596 RepID=A0A6J5WSQ1_PRUAR|nr:unnamed protein product [Prunus armeniaca]